jgi:ribokinase
MPAPDVLVVGDANPDVLLSGDVVPRFGQAEQHVDAEIALGGSGAIAAAALVRLGLPTALAAALGDDDLGALTAARIAGRGIDPRALQRSALPTGLSVHLLRDGDRAMLTRTGAIAGLDVARACDAVAGVRHVHVASVFLIRALAERGGDLVAAAHAAGATVSVDTNFDPAGAFAWPDWLGAADDGPPSADRLGAGDALLPNAEEALRLAGRSDGDVEAAAVSLAAGGTTVVVKLGADGALLADAGGIRHVAAPAAPVVVDAVGAGDAFDAGWIRARLDGRPAPDAAALACACGTLSLRAAGDAGQATLEEALALEAAA